MFALPRARVGTSSVCQVRCCQHRVDIIQHPGKDSGIFLKDNTSLSANGIFRVPEEFSFSHPLMNSYSLSILTMALGMEFECTGFLKGPSICVGPFPLRLIYGHSYFFILFRINYYDHTKVSRIRLWDSGLHTSSRSIKTGLTLIKELTLSGILHFYSAAQSEVHCRLYRN